MKNVFEQIVQTLKLGNILINYQRLSGGALHKMWHLETNLGHYALKEINPHISEKPSFPESYEVSEKIADLFHQRGVHAVSALKVHKHYVHKIADTWWVLFPYINGTTLPIRQLTEIQLKKIGEIFALMHTIDLKVPGVDKAHYDVFENNHWSFLINQVNISELTTLKSTILDWNLKYTNAIDNLNTHLIITHRDLHPNNVLWNSKNQPNIIDWETAGMMNPLLEVIGYGFEWGGIITENFLKSNTETILQNYQNIVKNPISKEEIQHAFYGWLGHCVMGWTEFNLRRMLGQTSNDKQEIERGCEIIEKKMLTCLEYIANHENKMLGLAQDILQ